MSVALSGQTVSVDPIDLNADLGEGFGRWTLTDDAALLSVVTSANVACGFHAGDPSTMRRVCEQAVEAGVRIGAQVSYRDLAGFGRRTMDVPSDELADEVTYQIGALAAFATAPGAALETLLRTEYRVSPVSNRVALRLTGAPLERAVPDELPSEGVVLGAVQVPADGQPLIFLADHPTTGGYPVVAVVGDADIDRCAQARPGTAVRFQVA